MRRITIKMVFLALLLLVFSSEGLCAESINIQVSCTIPEIPGVNTPFLASESKIIRNEKSNYEITTSRESIEIKQPSPMIQEDTQKNIADKKGDLEIAVKTLYPR